MTQETGNPDIDIGRYYRGFGEALSERQVPGLCHGKSSSSTHGCLKLDRYLAFSAEGSCHVVCVAVRCKPSNILTPVGTQRPSIIFDRIALRSGDQLRASEGAEEVL